MDADPTLLSPFYTNDSEFDRSVRRSEVQLRLLMDRGSDQRYLTEPDKSLFIADNPEDKEATKREFEQEGLNINYAYGSRYLGGLFGAQGGARGVGAAKG